MKRCEKCGIDVLVPRETCPLCAATLIERPAQEEERPAREIFPPLTTLYHAHAFLFRLLIFLSIVGATVCVMVNVIHPDPGWWSVIVLLGIGYMWVTILYGVRRPSRFCRIILYQLVALAAVTIGIDYVFGPNGWALDYVFPALCLAAMLAIAIIAIVGRLGLEDFAIYIVDNALLGLVPLIFILTGLSDVLWPSVTCIAASALCLVGMLVVGGRDMWLELRKRFHV